MARQKSWRCMVVGGAILAALALHAEGAAGQSEASAQSSSPTYAIPLKDGSTAVVWWDAVSDPAHPGWRCDLRASQGSGAGPTTTMALTAAVGDWRAALAEAREILKGRVVGGE